MSLRRYTSGGRWARLRALIIVTWLMPAVAGAETADIVGVILGRVYEVDRAKYEEYLEHRKARAQAAQGKDVSEEDLEALDPDDYLLRLPDAVVSARRISTNESFRSPFTDPGGEYMIQKTPIGAYGFTILHEGIEYPVAQSLDLNVELSYIAELCFVVDREEKVAWMISEGMRRDPDAPAFVPERCQSALSGCLAMLTGEEDGYPNGLLLLIAGSGAAAATLGLIAVGQDGLIAVDEEEASPPNRPPQN